MYTDKNVIIVVLLMLGSFGLGVVMTSIIDQHHINIMRKEALDRGHMSISMNENNKIVFNWKD